MPQAVGQDDVTRPEHRVVTHGLRKCLAVDRDARSLALGQEHRFGPVAHHHDIGPLGLAVERHGILLDNTFGLHAAMLRQVSDQVLPDPLLGSQHEVNSPQRIPDFHAVASAASTQPDGRKIEFGKPGHRSIEKFLYLYGGQIYELMRTILSTIALFSLCGLCAQEYTPSYGRELPRGEILVYPSAEAATAADGGDTRYFTRLTEWNLKDNVFSTQFTVPFAWANRQVLFHLGWASGDYEVRINGRPVAYNADGNDPSEFNITKQAKEGRNTLEVILTQPSAVAPLESWKEAPSPAIGGAWLMSQPTLRIRDVLTKTKIAEDGNATAEIAVVVKSDALNARSSRIHYQLLTPTGENAAAGHKDVTLDMRREDTLRFLARIPSNLLWNAELPTQYTLRLRTQHEGRYAEYLELRLGFRSVEMQESQMFLNARPVTLRAREVPPSITENEIAALREQGFNALKLLPGPVPESLLNFCDIQGLYVIAQAPVDTRRSGESRRKGGNPSNDPIWKPAYLERAENSYHTTKRHPSVVAFSLATQSANGINLYESYLNMKRFGDSRPFIYPDSGGEWNSDKLALE